MRAVQPTRDRAGELRGKYAEMLEMRLEHLSGEEDARGVRARMSGLASRFPGALREIDDLELAVIRARLAELDAVIRGEGEAASWMEAMALFHSLARGALCAKRWLAGRRHVGPEISLAYDAYVDALESPNDAREWAAHLADVAAPPRGRLMELVIARVALKLGSSRDQARRLVFGAPRKRLRK